LLPDRLQNWTIKHVEQLVERGVYESDQFDLKEMLPHPSDNAGKMRLRKTCAAFANSVGGYLIFGIADAPRKPQGGRIVGVAAAMDFPAQFGSFLGSCELSVEWYLKSPALPIGADSFVHVVHVPRSWKAPHAVADGDGWVFPKRNSKGTEIMSYSEIRGMFLGYYEKRMKLQLLRAEIVALTHLQIAFALTEDENNLFQSHLPPVELRVIENALDDTYSITHNYPNLLTRLAELRQEVRSLNSLTEMLRLQIAVHPKAGQYRVQVYHSRLQSHIINIAGRAKDVIAELATIIGAR